MKPRKRHWRQLNARELTAKYVDKNKRLARFIDGHPHRNEAKVGYCWSEQHKGWLTTRLMKEHDCVNKKCRHLQLYDPNYDPDKKDDCGCCKKENEKTEKGGNNE